MVNDTVATVKTEDSTYNCDLSLSHDFQSAGANIRVTELPENSDFAGYNKKFITEVGNFDPGAALEEFSRSGADKRLVKNDTLSLLTRQTHADNHDAFIFNMLISWYKAEMYKCANGKDEVLNVALEPYRDSHLTYDYNDSGVGKTIEVELGPPIDNERIEEAEWTVRNSDNYWSRPYVLHYGSSTNAQGAFYLLHVLGRNVTSELNFELPISGLNTGELLLDPVGARGNGLPSDFSTVPWGNPDILWTWIMDYVQMNRLNSSFASAFELLGALVYQPAWSTAESCAWQKAQLVVNLAEFSPTRGKIRLSLEGEEYVPSSIPHEFKLEEAFSPATYIMKAALMNYYAWYGVYSIVDDEARTRQQWRTVYCSGEGSLGILKTPHARAAAISTIIGHDVITNARHSCGISYDLSVMMSVREINVVPLEAGQARVLKIDTVFAPVSGELLLGTLSGDYDATQHLMGVQKVPKVEPGKSMTSLEVIRTANIYRLFGHDVEVYEPVTGRTFTPWARSRECVIEPASMGYRYGKPDQYMITRNDRREGRNHTIENVFTLLDRASASFVIRMPMITICNWQQRKEPIRPFISLRRRPKQKTFFVKSALSFNPDSFRARYIEPIKKDFRADETSLVPEAPLPPVLPPSEDVPAEHLPTTAEGVDPNT